MYSSKKGSKKSASTRNRKKLGKKRFPNRFEIEGDTEQVSSSAKKLKLSTDTDVNVDNNISYRILDLFTVLSVIATVVKCKTCDSEIKFAESSMRGLGFKVVLQCPICGNLSIDSCPIIKNAYEINRRFTFAMRMLGIGYTGMTKLCGLLDLPHPILKTFYYKIVDQINVASSAVSKLSMQKAAADEKQKAVENNENDGLTVSGDGSWLKRGFTSLCGITSLIGRYTGKVIDVLVKSKCCKICENWVGKEDTAEYEEWNESHQEKCKINHQGSSGKMEVDSVLEMFRRSEKLYQVKYINYVGDGDSKTFSNLQSNEVYDDVVIKKKECINHVQKRMGTRLRNLVKKTKGLSGKGKLTGKLIDELSIYYGLAIRRNVDSIADMKKEIFATLYHKISTDEVPRHENCPTGEKSWCDWQKARASKTLHAYKHKPAMPAQIYDAILPIYEDLSNEALLERCLGGFTQNSNESFNSVVWSIAPKTTHSGKDIVEIATNIAVIKFNDGLTGVMKVLELLKIKIGRNCYNYCVEADAQRVKFAEHSMSDAVKEARKSKTAERKEENEAAISSEGLQYGAGIAD